MGGALGNALRKAVTRYKESYPVDYHIMAQRAALIADGGAMSRDSAFFPFPLAVMNLVEKEGGSHIDEKDANNVRGMCLKFGDFEAGSKAIMCLASKTVGVLSPGAWRRKHGCKAVRAGTIHLSLSPHHSRYE